MNFTIVKIAITEHNIDMEPIRLATEEQIRASVRQGEDAVIALFNETVGKLAERIQRLEDQISKSAAPSQPPVRMGSKGWMC